MENSQNIKIDVDVKAEDYRRVLFWHDRKKILMAAIITFVSIPVLIIYLVYGEGLNPFDAENRDILSIVTLFIMFGAFPIALLTTLFLIWRQSKELEKISEETKFNFNEVGLESKSESTSFIMIWERFEKVCETQLDFIFFPQKKMLYPIPKRFFENQMQIDEFKKLLRQKLGDKTQLLK